MRHRLATALAAILASAGLAAEPTVSTGLSSRVFEDTNLYLQDAGPAIAGQAEPALPAKESATGIDAGASLGLAWQGSGDAAFGFGYAPEVIRYFHHASENHTDHVVTASAAGTFAGWAGDFKLRYLYTDGSHDSPIYTEVGGSPAIGGEPVRARRAQAIGRAAGKVTHDLGGGFVRGVFSVYDQDFRTRERTAAGYCNYADRDETSVGIDAGERIGGGLALVAGSRVGFQHQADILGVPLDYSNTFTRWLAGAEGSIGRTLKLSLLAGPDIRHFGHAVPTWFHRERRTGYGEAAATWTPTAADSFVLSAKRYVWVSGGGRGAYADAVIDLAWRRKLGAGWTSNVGANWHDGDFDGWSLRHDRIYTGSVGLSRAFANRLHVDVDLMHDRGLSLVADMPGREYTRWIGSLTIGRSW